MAVSSSSKRAKSGILFNNSGLHVMVISIARKLMSSEGRFVRCGAVKNSGKVHFESYLTADPWAGHVGAPQEGEGDAKAIAKLILASNQALDLVLTQTTIIGDATINLAAQREARVEVVQEGGCLYQ
jgi:hypothetical protein